MYCFDVCRWKALCILLPALGLPSLAQQTSLPATAPTRSVSELPSAQPQAFAGAAQQAQVRWTGAQLTIRATGQTLPVILQQVARLTGMKVTGAAPGEPVFGSYGPGPVQQVLASLFDGLSVNMLLLNGSPTQPKELVLTARSGGTTPTAPAQTVTVAEDPYNTNPADANLAQPHPGRHTSPNSFQAGTELQQDASQAAQPGGASFAPPVPLNDNNSSSGATSTDANGTPQSPNGTRTPEQIFEELRKRQQQASQQ